MMKNFLTISLLCLSITSLCADEICEQLLCDTSSRNLSSWLPWRKKSVNMRFVEVVNDITELVDALAEETEELQESIYYTVELNGVTIEPDQVMIVPVYDDRFTITVRSKKPFSEHIDFIPEKIRKITNKFPSLITTYYGFVCHVGPDVGIVHLAMPVLHGCNALKMKEPYRFSCKWPRGIQIWLRELIECH